MNIPTHILITKNFCRLSPYIYRILSLSNSISSTFYHITLHLTHYIIIRYYLCGVDYDKILLSVRTFIGLILDTTVMLLYPYDDNETKYLLEYGSYSSIFSMSLQDNVREYSEI